MCDQLAANPSDPIVQSSVFEQACDSYVSNTCRGHCTSAEETATRATCFQGKNLVFKPENLCAALRTKGARCEAYEATELDRAAWGVCDALAADGLVDDASDTIYQATCELQREMYCNQEGNADDCQDGDAAAMVQMCVNAQRSTTDAVSLCHNVWNYAKDIVNDGPVFEGDDRDRAERACNQVCPAVFDDGWNWEAGRDAIKLSCDLIANFNCNNKEGRTCTADEFTNAFSSCIDVQMSAQSRDAFTLCADLWACDSSSYDFNQDASKPTNAKAMARLSALKQRATRGSAALKTKAAAVKQSLARRGAFALRTATAKNAAVFKAYLKRTPQVLRAKVMNARPKRVSARESARALKAMQAAARV